MLNKYKQALEDIDIAIQLSNVIIRDSTIVNYLDIPYINLPFDEENMPIELEYILYERACSNFEVGNHNKNLLSDLNFCISKGLNIKECKKMKGIIQILYNSQEDGCRELYEVEKIEKGFAEDEIKKYCQSKTAR